MADVIIQVHGESCLVEILRESPSLVKLRITDVREDRIKASVQINTSELVEFAHLIVKQYGS